MTLFGRQAEIAQQYLRKGSRAYIEGRLRTRKYEKDGQTHYVTEIVAEQLQLIDRRQDSPADGNFSDGNSGYAPSRSASRSSGYSSGNQYASQPKTQNAFDAKNLRSNLDFKPLFCGFFYSFVFLFPKVVVRMKRST